MINTSTATTSLAEQMTSSLSSQRQNYTEDDWMQFLFDHREWLQQRPNTRVINLSEKALYRFRYRLSDYLLAHGYQSWMTTAVRIVNRLGCDQEFNTALTSLYLPTSDDVLELRRQYVTNRTKIRKL